MRPLLLPYSLTYGVPGAGPGQSPPDDRLLPGHQREQRQAGDAVRDGDRPGRYPGAGTEGQPPGGERRGEQDEQGQVRPPAGAGQPSHGP